MFKNMGDIMKQAQQMQSKMQALREELGKHEVEGSAGGGMVVVVLNGRSEPLRVRVDPKAAADVEMLEDLLLAAFRDAQQKVQELVKKEMGNMAGPIAGALGIPGL
jgi:DNA-binding YbaB/EbfC family protein